MNLGITPFIDRCEELVELLYAQPDRRVLSVKTQEKQIKVSPEMEEVNQSRRAWHFLTLGIPSLFEMLSVFFSGIIHRRTVGASVRAAYKSQPLSSTEAGDLFRFQHFNKFSHNPLKMTEFAKITQCVNRLINQAGEAKKAGDHAELDRVKEQLKPYQAILEKVQGVKVTRKDFDESDWKVMDEICFELACDHFSNLMNIFNSGWMVHSGLQAEIRNRFNVDYNESVLAESLSLSLAYIENIDGKTIALPLFDQETNKYRSVEYAIKKTTIGDGLPCYVLESEDPAASPWYITRGTQVYTNLSESGRECRSGSFESILADSLDPECISRNVVNKSLVKRPIVFENGAWVQKESLSDIFMKWKNEGKKVNLAGHSLGGTIINALAVEFFDQIRTAYTFSAPGVSYETAKRWKEATKGNEAEANFKLINYDYEGDIVPAGGKVLIGTHFAVESLNEWVPDGLHDSHVRSRLNRDFKMYKVDVKSENKKFVRGLCEGLRIITGLFFRVLLWCIDRKAMPDWWSNRKIYREYAAFEREIRVHQ